MIKTYTITNANGDILKIISCATNDLELNYGEGETAFEGVFKDQWFDWGKNEWVDIPSQPIHHWWDTATHQWIADPDALAEAQATQARQARQQALGAPFEALGVVFQADESSLSKMVSNHGIISITGDSIDWKLLDNSTITLTADELLSVIKGIYKRNQQIMKT